MKNGFRPSMGLVHTWAGLVVSWVLFFVFLTGTLGYFDTEIDRWMQPELSPKAVSARASVMAAQQRLMSVAPNAERWFIAPPTQREYANLYIFWQGAAAPFPSGSEWLDAATARPVEARDTGGGQALYQMHYSLHYMPGLVGVLIVGVCSMLMLVAIITGIVIHKRIFKDFFTFRPGSGPRSWLDFHNLLGVLALPFHLMITYSGLAFYLSTYMLLIIAGTYGFGEENRRAFFAELTAREAVTAAGVAAPLVPLEDLVAKAEARWGRNQVRSLDIEYPGDRNARISVSRVVDAPRYDTDEMVFDGVSGELLSATDADGFAAGRRVRDALLGLHEGLFAGPLLRLLYFLSGLIGTAMIGTGLILWSIKRRARQLEQSGGPDVGYRLVESLNLGTVLGLPVGIALYFWANRLLPLELANRAEWELHTLFLTWLMVMVYAFVRPIARAWREVLWVAVGAFALLPLVNALTTERNLVHSLLYKDWVFVGFDLLVFAVALLFYVAARKLGPARALRLGAEAAVAEGRYATRREAV